MACLRATWPALLAWLARNDHLREFTRDDVLAYLAGLYGHERRLAVSVLRSLFTRANRHDLPQPGEPGGSAPAGTVPQSAHSVACTTYSMTFGVGVGAISETW
jgi:hypothetical protein